MDEVFDYIPLIGDLYRGWRLGTRIASFFSNDDQTDTVLVQMYEKVNSAIDAETVEQKIAIIESVFDISERVSCQKKYQQAIYGYTLVMGGYIGAVCLWQNNLWNIDARKDIDNYLNTILEGCSNIANISITWFTDNDTLVQEMQQRTDDLAKQIRKTKKEMHKHYRHVDKILHPWKYRLKWMIPLILLLLIGWGFICYYFL